MLGGGGGRGVCWGDWKMMVMGIIGGRGHIAKRMKGYRTAQDMKRE
jgi:hypothetical protein